MNTLIGSSIPSWPAEPEQGSTPEQRLAWCAAVARWAPSKHNSQPWRFVVRDGALWVWPDLTRSLPLTDPAQRELVMSCGAAVQLAVVAAGALGYDLEVTWTPEPGTTLLARLSEGRQRPVTQQDRLLLAAAATRRTDRGPLDATTLPPSFRFELQSAAEACGGHLRLIATPAERTQLAELIAQADRLLVRDGSVDEELAAWRRGPEDLRGDGVPVDHTRGPAASYRAEFVQRDFSAGSGTYSMDRPGLDAPLVAVLSTQGDTTQDWLRGGRALAAVLLHAATLGASSSYLNQPCETPALRHLLGAGFSIPGHPQVVLRIGIGGTVRPTPRRQLGQVLTVG